MKDLLIILTLAAMIFLFFGKERTHEDAATPVSSKQERSARVAETMPDLSDPASESLPLAPGALPVEEQIYTLEDDELIPYLSALLSEITAEKAGEVFPLLYEETQLRPPHVQLPLLLELARHPYSGKDLSTTIMATMGALLETDHGFSWADWSLALHEHLANEHGIIMTE